MIDSALFVLAAVSDFLCPGNLHFTALSASMCIV